MGIYDESKYEVNEDLEEVHGQHLRELGNPGTWGNVRKGSLSGLIWRCLKKLLSSQMRTNDIYVFKSSVYPAISL